MATTCYKTNVKAHCGKLVTDSNDVEHYDILIGSAVTGYRASPPDGEISKDTMWGHPITLWYAGGSPLMFLTFQGSTQLPNWTTIYVKYRDYQDTWFQMDFDGSNYKFSDAGVNAYFVANVGLTIHAEVETRAT